MWQATGVVLSGGKSSRMGVDKAFLEFNHHTFLEHAVEKLGKNFAEVIIVSNEKAKYNALGVKVAVDIYRNKGPLGGIHAALSEASHDLVFVTACDMPFWEPEAAELLIESCKGYDAAVPSIGRFYEPLLAVYTKNCRTAIENCLDRNMNKISDFYPKVTINYINQALMERVCLLEKNLCNINTFEEYKKMRNAFKGGL